MAEIGEFSAKDLRRVTNRYAIVKNISQLANQYIKTPAKEQIT